mmetsp:Transcript_8810/g.16385  ORF Transcript_8810/g.16385 Transcript_8810/m.16385 type:complete len:437 (-) Transcript_8810:36-1346(-)
MSRRLHKASPSPVFDLQNPVVLKRRKQNRKKWNVIHLVITSTAIVSSVVLIWYQTGALASLAEDDSKKRISVDADNNNASPPNAIPLSLPAKPEPLRFIAVVGMYHSGTSAMYRSIQSNEEIASEKGIDLKAYVSGAGGYPPCGVALRSDSTVDMSVTMGNSSGIDEPNTYLFGKYGAMWGDWNEEGPHTLEGVLQMEPPSKSDVFYTWWKHTPPQHPVLACFRPDTLYVVMVRHPKVWKNSMKRRLYDFKYERLLKLWRLVRNNPRRMPPLEMRFRSLYNAWEYYMRGYTSWEAVSAGKNCHVGAPQSSLSSSDSTREGGDNCLGGANKIPNTKRNMVIVRYEDYLMKPKKVLAEIFSFATFGLIDAKADEDKFMPVEEKNLQSSQEMLQNLKDQNFFSTKSVDDWEGATYLDELCVTLGYSCDESAGMFIDDDK